MIEAFSAADRGPTMQPQGPMLIPAQTAIIGFFVHMAQIFGIQKSIGEVYGLLFVSPNPLPMDEIVTTLAMSKGSASQGLKMLRAIKAVRRVYKPSDRRDHYIAETELRKLVAGFVKERIGPELASGAKMLGDVEEGLAEIPEQHREFFQSRVEKLRAWQEQAKVVLPFVSEALADEE